jgi:hypothetical protein
MTRVLQTKRMLATAALVVATCLTLAGVGHASPIVAAGFDLFETQAPASFDFNTIPNPQIVDFEGLPLDFFDFGSGLVPVGTTDTIVERLELADLGGGFDTIDIEIVALSLVSIAPVDLGFGAGFEDLFVTLNTSSPSFQSNMTIFDGGEGNPHGVFDSQLNFSFDVTGGVGGFYATIEQTFLSFGTPWSHDHDAGAMLIDGVNHNLDGGSPHSHGEDFFIGATLHTGPHPVNTGTVPEPSTGLLIGLGFVAFALIGRR